MARFRKAYRVAAYTGLALPLVAILLVPLYARTTPRLAGLPFFYWFQFAWILLSAALMAAGHLLLKRADSGVGTPGTVSGAHPHPGEHG
ncbi:DUF3311 domain-containing protein [Dactylosporangium roseum]|uniref:DUF3311 domain-containing protein n=1 Tax=Dactylosporangium roseum TaxID=47989 RepID=A0ABY5YYH3_9ACTN|nr:DUF3311 domain-containing protein [Dactylosporangium roseum]UWZ34282.1 DUF3311 domain-containing protein [Dactylosporangium roseum]